MSYLIKSCIFPIIDGQDCIGQGFAASGYFITAAHVVRDYPKCFIMHKGQSIMLSELTPLYGGEGDVDKDAWAWDVIIYSIKGMDSFLHLSGRSAKEGEIRSCCVFPHFDSDTGEWQDSLSVEKAVYEREVGNYIYCKCNRNAGSSGSPLVIGNEVVGIMHGGDEEKLCAFLRPISFMYPEHFVPYEEWFIREWGKMGKPEEPHTAAWFDRRAREQMGDAFDGEIGAYWNVD